MNFRRERINSLRQFRHHANRLDSFSCTLKHKLNHDKCLLLENLSPVTPVAAQTAAPANCKDFWKRTVELDLSKTRAEGSPGQDDSGAE